ncbi:MAG TPA: glycoside hydrolase family 16 protein [Kineosporiaceae bacterium]|nr:glycoside hydrolase family 16 protein [Kineosporiaceae bacterium]
MLVAVVIVIRSPHRFVFVRDDAAPTPAPSGITRVSAEPGPPPVGNAPSPSDAVASAPPSGFTTIWSDDFSGAAGSGVNTANWLYDTGHGYPGGATNWGTGEIETMTSSTANVLLDGAGHLAITPVRDAAGNWTSGRIETRRTDFSAPAGGILRVEASIQQPNVTTSDGVGYWPAFWMLGAAARPVGATNWPGIGEIDVLENVNGRSSVWSTLHCGVVSGGPCNETTGLGSGEHACPGCQTRFHTYAVEYDRSVSPEQIRWYLDGANFFTLSQTAVDATTWANTVQHGFFIILNVAMGGGFPAAFGGGTPTAATASGRPMLVDYVSVATRGGSAPAPVPTVTSGPSRTTPGAKATIPITVTPSTRPPTGTAQPVGPPRIAFSSVPPIGSSAHLTGRVGNVDVKQYRVVVFIKVDGVWWVKPYWASPLTAITADGTWSCDIVTGGNDQAASEIEAFVVRSDIRLPAQPSYSDVQPYAVAHVSTSRS